MHSIKIPKFRGTVSEKAYDTIRKTTRDLTMRVRGYPTSQILEVFQAVLFLANRDGELVLKVGDEEPEEPVE